MEITFSLSPLGGAILIATAFLASIALLIQVLLNVYNTFYEDDEQTDNE